MTIPPVAQTARDVPPDQSGLGVSLARVSVIPDMIRELFLQDCDDDTAEQALGRLTRQSLEPFTPPPRIIAWHQKPAT